jgi:hypothetical protein
MSYALPSCKAGLTPEDLDFLVKVLGGEGARLQGLLSDPDCLDRMLEDPRVFRALLELRGCLRISLPFYFYVLVRHSLRREDLDDAHLSDYVAGRLCRFASGETRNLFRDPEAGASERNYEYLFEIWEEAERSEGERRYRLQVYLGDYALLLSGLFPRRLQNRVERRGAPGIAYYEEMGSASYRLAGQTGTAEKLGMGPLLLTLCQAFHTARLALNGLAQNVVFLDSDPHVAKLLNDFDTPFEPPPARPS